MTHLIVQGYDPNFPSFPDIDLSNDGVLFPNDPNVWSSVLDAVGFVESATVPPVATEYVYGAALGFEDIGPDDVFVPGMLFRDETQMDAWQIGAFALDVDDTLGRINVESECDFNNDTFCNLADMNLLLGQGNLVAGVAGGAPFDLVVDGTLNQSDVDTWLSVAATNNDYDTHYQRGDTDGLDTISPDVRDVDITDCNNMAPKFMPIATARNEFLGRWDCGDFDGDGDINITDFNSVASNFNPIGYGPGDAGQAVPEPAGIILVAIALLVWIIWSLSRRIEGRAVRC